MIPCGSAWDVHGIKRITPCIGSPPLDQRQVRGDGLEHEVPEDPQACGSAQIDVREHPETAPMAKGCLAGC